MIKLIRAGIDRLAARWLANSARRLGSEHFSVAVPDMGDEDWAIVWSGNPDDGGFSLVAPHSFDFRKISTEGVSLPMGASFMLSLYAMIQKDGPNFANDVIERATGKKSNYRDDADEEQSRTFN